jgi:hypothetical protein
MCSWVLALYRRHPVTLAMQRFSESRQRFHAYTGRTTAQACMQGCYGRTACRAGEQLLHVLHCIRIRTEWWRSWVPGAHDFRERLSAALAAPRLMRQENSAPSSCVADAVH